MIGNLPGLAVWLLARTDWAQPALNLSADRVVAFAATSASFAFTMLGFLAASLSLVAGAAESSVFRKYKKNGYFASLQVHTGLTMLELLATFVFAMSLFFGVPGIWRIQTTLALTVASGCMATLAVIPVLSILIKSAEDSD